MNFQCENCGHSVLETDTVCWHCGWKVTRPKRDITPSAQATKRERDLPPISLSAIAIYSTLTLVVFISILFVLGSLGKQSLNRIEVAEVPSLPGWLSITDQNQNYTISLPPDWEWLEKHNPQQQAKFNEMVLGNPQFQAVIMPYEDPLPELQLIALATIKQRENQNFLLIARDVYPNQPDITEVISLLNQQDLNNSALEMMEMDDSGGDQQGLLQTEFIDQTQSYRCLQKLIQVPQATFLLSGCSASEQFQNQLENFQTILNSFRLSHQ